MKYSIRPSTPDDIEALGRVHSLVWQETYRGLLPDDVLMVAGSVEKRTAIRREIFTHTSPRHAHFMVEDETGKLVGFSDCGPAREVGEFAPAEITTLYLLHEAQGKGLGRELLARMLRHLAEQGYGAAALSVLLANTESRCFYEKCGGQLVREAVKNIGGKDIPIAIYRWGLPV